MSMARLQAPCSVRLQIFIKRTGSLSLSASGNPGTQQHGQPVQIREGNRADYILAKEIQTSNYSVVLEKIDTFLYECDSAYITICTDVFSSAFAPGVSATQTLGLDPEAVLLC